MPYNLKAIGREIRNKKTKRANKNVTIRSYQEWSLEQQTTYSLSSPSCVSCCSRGSTLTRAFSRVPKTERVKQYAILTAKIRLFGTNALRDDPRQLSYEILRSTFWRDLIVRSYSWFQKQACKAPKNNLWGFIRKSVVLVRRFETKIVPCKSTYKMVYLMFSLRFLVCLQSIPEAGSRHRENMKKKENGLT